MSQPSTSFLTDLGLCALVRRLDGLHFERGTVDLVRDQVAAAVDIHRLLQSVALDYLEAVSKIPRMTGAGLH